MEERCFRKVKNMQIEYLKYREAPTYNGFETSYFEDVNIYIDTRDGITIIDNEKEYFYNISYVISYEIENYKDIPEEIGE